MLTNFELKRLKPKLDIVEKPENRVHKLTDSNGALDDPHIVNDDNFNRAGPHVTTYAARTDNYK